MSIPFQPLSDSVYSTKYQLHNKFGSPIDKDRIDTFSRVAKALAKDEKDSAQWEDKFFWAMTNGAIPAGRILSNAGSEEYKPNTSLINCTVSGTVFDSIYGIGESLRQAGITLSTGSGIGYEFSTLRPRGSFVNGVGAKTSGPLPFADVFDKLCFTIASAGGRRGAQMATFDVRHPDVRDFIKVKREDGRFRQFNISVLIPDSFMDKKETEWALRFPVRYNDPEVEIAYLESSKNFVFDYWHIKDDAYIYDDKGLTLFKIYEMVKKQELWDLIMRSAYDYAEPGVLFIDKINSENNLYFCEDVRATNPCGEEPLPPFGSCLLGSVDLTKFILDPFTDNARFNFNKYCEVVSYFTRLLDNVVEYNGLPLTEQRNEILTKRRHGMGVIGLGSALSMLGIRYGSEESLLFADKVMKHLAVTGYKVGIELAKEKGSAPVLETDYEVTEDTLKYHPELRWYRGKKVKGRELFVQSNYMQRLFATELLDKDLILDYGCRFTHHSAVAPTGTISLAMCNNVSGGLEPSFSNHYFRNLTVEGKKTRQQESVYSYEALLFKELNNLTEEQIQTGSALPDYFVTADSLTWKEHVDMLATVQKWTDAGCSKTCNVPTDISFEEFKNLYQYAYDKNCKAVSTYRYNPETLGAVLSRNEDLENTRYQFTLEDGTVVTCKGSDKIEYDGEVTTAENLFNSLKENLYGRF